MIGYPKIETLFERNPVTHKVTKQIRRPEFLAINRWIVTEKIHGMNIRVRITPRSDAGALAANVEFSGRTDRAQLPKPLLASLQEIFTPENAARIWEGHDQRGPFEVILFGEGYGPGIQKGGAFYAPKPSFRLFDVFVPSAERYSVMEPEAFETLRRYLEEVYGNGTQAQKFTEMERAARSSRGMWLEWNDVQDVVRKLEIKTVPVLSEIMYATSWTENVREGVHSRVAAIESAIPGKYIAEGIVARSNPELVNRRGQRAMWKLKTSDFAEQR